MKSKKLNMFLFVILMIFIKSLLKKFDFYVGKKNVPFKNQTFTQAINKSEQNISMNSKEELNLAKNLNNLYSIK